jgi:hypothetical protein
MLPEQNQQTNSETEKVFEQGGDEDRLPGNSSGINVVQGQSGENMQQEIGAGAQERDKGHNRAAEEGRIDTNQTHDRGGEAQNVEDDGSGRLEGDEAERARNKAQEGQRQGRDD